MDSIYTPLGIIGFAALLHASFQLGASLLTLLSGHSLSIKRSQFRVFRLTSSFSFGNGTMIILLLSFLALFLGATIKSIDHALVWSILSGLLVGIGLAVWFTYYRTGQGTSLWVPRGIASFLQDRVTKTKRSAESFSLGLSSVIGELLFLIAPLAVAAYALLFLPASWQLVAILGYSAIALLPLITIWALVGYGVKISRIQAWRERNKHFLQHTAALGLIVLGVFTYVNEVMGGLS